MVPPRLASGQLDQKSLSIWRFKASQGRQRLTPSRPRVAGIAPQHPHGITTSSGRRRAFQSSFMSRRWDFVMMISVEGLTYSTH